MEISIISFFTGAGFLDMGFEEVGFNITWTNEYNQAFADIYEFAITKWRKSKDKNANVAVITNRSNIEELEAEDIIQEAFPGSKPEIFGIIGGPPCPDFSVRGKNEGKNGKHGKLTKTYVELIKAIKPSFFIMENVPGLYRTKKHHQFFQHIKCQLKESGYLISSKILNALEYGVPQDRERLFVVGFLEDILPSHIVFKAINGEDWFKWPTPKYENPKAKSWPRTNKFGGNPVRPDGIPIGLTVYPLLFSDPSPKTLPNGTDIFKAYSDRFWCIDEGDTSKSSFKRLHRYRYSPTTCYGNNEVHLHPTEPRRLSVREALRIQSIPDEYELPAKASLTDKFKTISNGVPYEMAKEVAKSLYGFIESIGLNDEIEIDSTPLIIEESGESFQCPSEQYAMSMK